MLTPAQQAIRKTGIGASEIGSIIGADGAWDSPLSVWAKKVGIRDEPENVPEYIELGNLLEPVIATLYARRHDGIDLYEPGTLVHPSDPLRIATPDRLVRGTRKGLQIKKARTRARWGSDGTDEVPENILAQVQWEMSVADLDLEDVPVLFWGSKLEVFSVRRDDELIGHMVDMAHKWWKDHVVARVPPPPDGHERTREAISCMFRKNNGRMAPEPPSGRTLAMRYKGASAKASAAESEKEALGNALRMLVGDADGFEGLWGNVTWKRDSVGKAQWKAIAEALGASDELIKQHTSEPGRTLRVHLKKGAR